MNRRAAFAVSILSCIFAVGCGPTVIRIRPTTVTVASVVSQTPEGQTCWRQCKQIESSCIPGCHVEAGLLSYSAAKDAVQQCMDSCANTRDECFRGCPGAVDLPAATPSPTQ